MRNHQMMHIKAINLQNMGPFTSITLDDLDHNANIINGCSGTGKTTLLRAVWNAGGAIRSGATLGSWVQGPDGLARMASGGEPGTPQLEGVITVGDDRRRVDYAFGWTARGREVEYLYEEGRANAGTDDETRMNLSRPGDSTRSGMRYTPDPDPEDIGDLIAYVMGNVSPHAMDATGPSELGSWQADIRAGHRLMKNGRNLPAVLALLEEHDPSRLDDIISPCRSALDCLGNITIEREHGQALLRWEHRRTGRLMEAGQAPDGMIHMLKTMTAIGLRGHGDLRYRGPTATPVVLIDDVDQGMDDQCAMIMAERAGRPSDRQLIMTSRNVRLARALGDHRTHSLANRNGDIGVVRTTQGTDGA